MKKHICLVSALLLVVVSGCAGTKKIDHAPAVMPPAAAQEQPAEDNQTATVTPPDISAEPVASTPEPAAAPSRTIAANMLKKAASAKWVQKSGKHSAPADAETDTEELSGEKISLNFDNADIYEVINALSDFLGINYIIDPSVKGKVNIHTHGEIDKTRLLPVLETIFEMNNIALVEFGDMYKIVPIKEAKKQLFDFSFGRELDEMDSYDRIIIQIVPLHYVPSSEVVKVLKQFVGKGGDIIEYKKGNVLIMIETAATIQKLLKLIDVIDIDTFDKTGIRFFKVRNAEVKDVAKELEQIFTSFGINKKTGKELGLQFIPIERVSCVLAVSAIPGIFEKVEHWLGLLDTVDLEAEEQVFIYFVENGKADEIADVLKKVYGDGKSKKTTKRQPVTRTKKGKKTRTNVSTTTTLEGDIKIVTDEATNSIIVHATPHDYSIIKATMQKLDIIPKQVLIEVLIAEVTLSGDTEFGIEWALLGDMTTLGGYKGLDDTKIDFGLGSIATTGFSYSFESDRLQAFLLAQASQNKLNILQSPHILVADNKEARIEVGKEVPIVTSEYVPQDVDSSTSTSRSIEYRSTGIILSVTPRINDKGLVAMDISQEVSEAQEITTSGIQS
ncbi:MAG: type II secretion system secretin GspD, partial [Deltaproteobacteria bacterium]|nr:type II secretion system secretin GspD [Deltaproteobacteria bacterium]